MSRMQIEIPIEDIVVEEVPYFKVVCYLKKAKYKPNFWIPSIRRKLCLFARYNGIVVGATYVVIDHLTDKTWQVNCISCESSSVYVKMIKYCVEKCKENKRSLEMFHRKDINELMVSCGMIDTGKRMRLELA